jgi:hypothetical protein
LRPFVWRSHDSLVEAAARELVATPQKLEEFERLLVDTDDQELAEGFLEEDRW